MTVIYAHPPAQAHARAMINRKIRLVDPNTARFLHTFGTGTTADPAWSWSGFRFQADVLRDRAEARGEPWPFIPAPLDGEPAPHVDQIDRVTR